MTDMCKIMEKEQVAFEEKYMSIALAEAKHALEEGEVPIGAVLIFEDEVLARAHNMPISLSDPTAHAEILALRKAAAKRNNYRLPNTTLYVTVEPCLMCMGALVQARVKKLVFGAFDPKGGACVSVYDLHSSPASINKMTVISGVLEEECREIIQGFFRSKR
jgi:tRNA(adenine34) deaminase